MLFFNGVMNENENEKACSEKKNENDCINDVVFENPYVECVFYKFYDFDNSIIDSGCYYAGDPEANNIYNSRNILRHYELIGIDCIRENKKCFCPTRQKYLTKTKNYEIDFRVGGECPFTLEEKKIFESNKHCLNYFDSTIKEGKFNVVNKEDCHNALLLEQSKEFGITCAFYGFTVILKNSTKLHFKTCYFIYEDMKEIEKTGIQVNKEWLYPEDILESILEQTDIDPDKDIESFSTDISDLNKVYSKSIDSEEDYSKLISSSKYLILLFIIIL